MFVRFVTDPAAINRWIKLPKKGMVKQAFGRKRNPDYYKEVSVFKVTDHLETAYCATGFLTTQTKEIVNQVLALVIEESELDQFGIVPVKRKSKTGIDLIDEKHFELEGDEQKYEELARHLMDQERPLSRRFVVLSIRVMILAGQKILEESDIPDDKKQNLRKLLEKTKFDFSQICAE